MSWHKRYHDTRQFPMSDDVAITALKRRPTTRNNDIAGPYPYDRPSDHRGPARLARRAPPRPRPCPRMCPRRPESEGGRRRWAAAGPRVKPPLVLENTISFYSHQTHLYCLRWYPLYVMFVDRGHGFDFQGNYVVSLDSATKLKGNPTRGREVDTGVCKRDAAKVVKNSAFSQSQQRWKLCKLEYFNKMRFAELYKLVLEW